MKTLHPIALCLLVTALIVPSPLFSRDKSKIGPLEGSKKQSSQSTDDRPLDNKTFFSGAPVDTFILADFTFDKPDGTGDTEGWYGVDLTTQDGLFSHVDDFAGMNGGDFNRLTPLSGNQSLWCGTRADSTSELFCAFVSLPGYGNYWSQHFESIPIPVIGDAVLSYQIRWDTEPNYDYVYVEYMDTGGVWIELANYTGIGETSESWIVPDGESPDSIQIRFRFEDDGAYSDEDGLWNTDGAFIIDSLSVADTTGVVDYQDFESELVGATATADGRWYAASPPGFGDYAGLFHGSGLQQDDPCASNLTYLWGFFDGSPDDYYPGCGGLPGQKAVPFGNDRGQYIHNEIWSPWIDWTHDVNGTPVPATASMAFFDFDVYVDLPLDNLVFYTWKLRAKVNGCATLWAGDNFLHHNTGNPHWRLGWNGRRQIATLVPAGATEVQLSIGTYDSCPIHCGWLGTGACHSHAPLIDNVKLGRIDTPGPTWEIWDPTLTYYEPELFQDNFPEITEYTRPGNGEVTSVGKVRVDIGQDILSSGYPNILPGDSLTIIVLEPTYGLAPDPSGGRAVYLHVKDIPGKSGSVISGGSRWPYVPSLSGGGWTVLRMDSVPLPAREYQFCVDLNDNLYEAGDVITYYLSAIDGIGRTTFWTEHTRTVTDESLARELPMEMTCLPANALTGGTDILFVDGHDGGGAQPYFDYDFKILGITPDRYDIHHSGFNNGLGSRVKDVAQQLIPYYKKIIWSSGNLQTNIIGDGDTSARGIKTDDFRALHTFLNEHTEDCGVYFAGDNLPSYWSQYCLSFSAMDFRDDFMDYTLVNRDHVFIGEPLSPLTIGQTGSCFDGDTLVAHGGCPTIRQFDVVTPTGTSELAMAFSGNPGHGAIISQETLNPDSAHARVLLSSFGYDAIRDDRVQNPYDRVVHLHAIITWLGNELDEPTGTGTAPGFEFYLTQNHPNPFNPTTEIRYSIRERARVSLRVYNVAGQVVATLVNGYETPGAHTVTWNGKNNTGASVSSGVYFYRLVAGNQMLTKKMVFLK